MEIQAGIVPTMAYRPDRKRPLPEERLQLVVPAELKKRFQALALKEKIPMQVLIRLAMEKKLAALDGDRSDSCQHMFACDCRGTSSFNYKGK